MPDKTAASLTRIRVLVADDHPVVRHGLTALIDDAPDMESVADAEDGQQALALWRKHRPDVGLIDLQMPQLNGVDTIAAIRREQSDARLVILSTYETDDDIQRGLAVGARAYLLKDVGHQTLLDTIRAVHAGKRRFAPEVAEKMADHLSEEKLSERELEVLRRIFAGRSNGGIAADLDVSEATVKAHVKALLRKLKAVDRTQAVVAGLRRGLLRL